MALLHRIQSYPMLSKKILGTLVLVVLLVAILEIWLVNRLSTYGQGIAKLEQSAQEIQMQNQILKNQIDLASSLVTIQERAKNLGFQSIHKLQYLRPVDVAFNFR